MLTNEQLQNLENNAVSIELLTNNGLGDEYYTAPLKYLENMEVHPTCSGQEYRIAVETANDEDFCPPNAGITVIVDGVLACLYRDILEECGLDLITYFSYRFKPSKRFMDSLREFEKKIYGEDQK